MQLVKIIAIFVPFSNHNGMKRISKRLQTGEARIIDGDANENPKLGVKKLSDGRLSLFLNYYYGKQTEIDPKTGKETQKALRQFKSLNLYIYADPRTVEEREHNGKTIEYAKGLRYEAEQELKLRERGYRVPSDKTDVDFLKYFREYIKNYTKKDIKMVELAYNRFIDFLNATPKYKSFVNGIKPRCIDKDMVTAYTEYLQTRSVGSGAWTIYGRFKKVVKYAFEHEVFTKNPCTGISIKTDNATIKKDFLSLEEIQTLSNTPFQGNQNIKRAFLFCCYTGIRFCDVKELTFGNVDYSNRLLKFVQSKTEGHSAAAGVVIPLWETTLTLIGERGETEAKIFPLPSYELCCRYVKMWVKRAGIDKHISWHCARHSFATNLAINGNDAETIRSLMGHASLSMTMRYFHAVDSLKREAVESFPALNL